MRPVYHSQEWLAMMSAIRAAPEDDFPKVIAADLLEESGEERHADFLRMSAELSQINDNLHIPHWAHPPLSCNQCRAVHDLRNPCDQEYRKWLLWKEISQLVHEETGDFRGADWRVNELQYHCGFPSVVNLTCREFLKQGLEIYQQGVIKRWWLCDRAPRHIRGGRWLWKLDTSTRTAGLTRYLRELQNSQVSEEAAQHYSGSNLIPLPIWKLLTEERCLQIASWDEYGLRQRLVCGG